MINAHANEMLWPEKNENKKTKVDEKKLFLKKLFCWNTYKKYEQQWWREIFIQKQKKNGHPLCLFHIRAFNLFKNFIEMSKNVIYVYECKV